jgi:hypothetical protein
MGHGATKGEEEGNYPAAGAEIHHPIAAANPGETDEEHRVQGEAISFSRLKDLEAPPEEAVQGFVSGGGKNVRWRRLHEGPTDVTPSR